MRLDDDDIDVALGSEQEASLYRDEMRDVWDTTQGALAWMKKIAR